MFWLILINIETMPGKENSGDNRAYTSFPADIIMFDFP